MSTPPASGLRVGFIGAGWTERVQIPTFLLGGLQAQAISAGHIENARRVAATYDIPDVFADWRDLIRAESVDLVSIVTPPPLHAEMAVAALQAGKHVICEKPTALNMAEAEAMFAAAQAAPARLAIVDHELRFHPPRAHLRRMLRDGAIGNPLYLYLDWLYGHRLDAHLPWNWHSDADQGGGTLGALGSHLLDLARWLLGRVDALAAQLQIAHFERAGAPSGAQGRVTADDAAHLMLHFRSGVQGRVAASALHPEDVGMSVLLVGTEGALRVDYADRLWAMRTPNYPKGEWQEIHPPGPVVDLTRLPNTRAFTVGSYHLARALAEAHQAGGPLTLPDAASFYDGLVVQRMLDAARRSHRERAWVSL
jgi:predicted dehydrogenase